MTVPLLSSRGQQVTEITLNWVKQQSLCSLSSSFLSFCQSLTLSCPPSFFDPSFSFSVFLPLVPSFTVSFAKVSCRQTVPHRQVNHIVCFLSCVAESCFFLSSLYSCLLKPSLCPPLTYTLCFFSLSVKTASLVSPQSISPHSSVSFCHLLPLLHRPSFISLFTLHLQIYLFLLRLCDQMLSESLTACGWHQLSTHRDERSWHMNTEPRVGFLDPSHQP